jgi:L-phenylalanine/L-methionine N-acetyltransferase
MAEILAVTIRALEPDDYADMAELFRGRRAQSGTLQLPFPSSAKWKKRIESQDDNSYRLVAVVDGKVVGSGGLHMGMGRRRHTAEIGMAVHDDYQGRGVGTALLSGLIELAERWLGLIRLELTVYTDNERAIALYKRLGFVVEGTLRKYGMRDGQYVDAYTMARVDGNTSKDE